MAVIKLTNSKGNLKKILNYITQEEKTDEKLISGQNCMPESVFEEMQTVKNLHGKNNGRQYIHIVQSFSPNDELTHEKAHEIGVKLAEYFKDFQILVATHKDKNHIHNHLVINSVSIKTGLKFQQSKEELKLFKQFSDNLCLKYDLNIIEKKTNESVYKQGEYRTAEKGESWKFKLINAIDKAMSESANKADFIDKMGDLGYGVVWTDSRKNITYTTPNGLKCRDNKLHNVKYLKEKMEGFFDELTGVTRTQQGRGNAGKTVHSDDFSNSRGALASFYSSRDGERGKYRNFGEEINRNSRRNEKFENKSNEKI